MIKKQCVGFLSTPPLWIEQQFDIQQFEFPTLEADDYEPVDIPQNIRLGHQVEHIFKQLISSSETYDVIVYNLPIRQDKRTLGEIDFILKDTVRNRLIHVELTYKFYIIDPAITPTTHSLIGPNRRDSFFLKMEKTKNIQFPLLHSAAGVQALEEVNIDSSNIEQQCCFKAQLFKPYTSKTTELGPLNPDCVIGYWLRLEDLGHSEFSNCQYYLPTKSEWIITPHSYVRYQSYTNTVASLNLQLLAKRAPMVWMKRPDGRYEKLFVVWW